MNAENCYSGYGAISEIYDKINSEVDYKSWADFIEACFDRYLSRRPELVLDLACGTGSMTMELARRGYDMIGVDGSEEMLAVALDRKFDAELESILYLRQDMRELELYGTVGAVTSCLDSINYLSGDKDIDRCFSLVHNYLDPDGLFLFDVNTPYKFENIYADNSFVHEDEVDGRAVLCAWQNDYDKISRTCKFYLSVFSEDENGRYIREDEEQTEKCFDRAELECALEHAGFEVLGVFGDFSFGEAKENDTRWYFAARAKK